MKLTKLSFDLLQALLFSLAVVCSTIAVAAENPADNSIAHQLVDINSADASTFAEIMDGVGLVKAQAIIAFRELIGRFVSLDQLLEVKGIGPEILEKNRHKLTVMTQ